MTLRDATPKIKGSPLGDLLDIAAVEGDGLIVTKDGCYVRLIEITRVPNLFSATPEERNRTITYWQALCSSIPDAQELWFFVLRNPLPPQLVSAADLEAARTVALHDLERNPDAQADARLRLRLQQLTATTVDAAATGDIGASWARHYAAVVWRPVPRKRVDKLTRTVTRPKGGARWLEWADHYNAARAVNGLAESVAARLSDSGSHAFLLEGPLALALLWERLHPAAGPHPDPERLAALCRPVAAGDPWAAAQVRADLVDELVAGMPEYDIPEASLDPSNSKFLCHADGTIEETLYLARQPTTADPWWLDPLSQTALASTLAVRIVPQNRGTTRFNTRNRVARRQAALDNKKRPASREEWKVLDETETVHEDLQGTAGATVYKVSIYLSLRCTWGDPDALENTAGRLATDLRTNLDATLMRGFRLGTRGALSTFPTATDHLGRTTRWAHRDMGHLAPLSSSRCGHDVGIPLGFAWPHATLERLDFYDSQGGTYIVGITGKGGHGKTLTANMLAARSVPRGMRLRIIDRSTVHDAEQRARTGGHYDALISLIPGSARVSIGTKDENAARINPWDVDDLGRVDETQITFLAALHDLLIGEVVGGNASDRRLDATDKALITNAITDVYESCAAAGDGGVEAPDPTESMLAERLYEMFEEAAEEEALRARITSLITRLAAYWGDGHLAFLMDEPTTIPRDSPALVFDTTGVPRERLAAVQFIVLQAINTEAERLQQHRLSSRTTAVPVSEWEDRLQVIVEEIWHLTDTEAGTQMLKEWARRGRHLLMVLVYVTQFLSDLDSEGGRGLLGQTSTHIMHFQPSSNVEPVAAAAGLTKNDIEQIADLTTRKGEFSEAFVKTSAGRGKVRMAYAAPEFWALAQDPEDNQPVRLIALEEAGGDPWRAIELLADPVWQARVAVTARP